MATATERANPRTSDIDLRSTREVLEILCAEDRSVPDAVSAQLDSLEAAAELMVECVRVGGSIHSFGAGSSGRLAALDAVEIGPTFGVRDGLYVAHLAGGSEGSALAQEAAEDDDVAGSVAASALRPIDVALGVSASGSTPFVKGALTIAQARGAATVLVTCSPSSPLLDGVDVGIVLDTGPEPICGSTRLKAGTATKLVLNALSTTVMVRAGRTYSHYMVHLEASNAKLRARAVRILEEVATLDADSATSVLESARFDLPVAVVMALGAVDADVARAALERGGGVVRNALALVGAAGSAGAVSCDEVP